MRWGKTGAELATWHPWFAWHPVTLPNGRRAWLRWLERRLDAGPYPKVRIGYDYRLPRRRLAGSRP